MDLELQKFKSIMEGETIIEMAEYKDSGEFTADLEEVSMLLEKIAGIVTAEKWDDWMDLTDKASGLDSNAKNQKLVDAISKAQTMSENLWDELGKYD